MAGGANVNARAQRAFRRALEDSAYLYEALQRMIVDELTAEHGRVVTAANVNGTFPELRATFAGTIATADLASEADERVEAEEIAEGLVYPDELARSFWQRLRMAMHRNVVVIHSATRRHHVDLQLLTDGRNDWFFNYWDTNYAGDEYTIGAPTKSTRASRRREVLTFARDAWDWISEPGRLTTSLTKDDLQWLRASQGLPVGFRRGSLSRL